MVEHEFLYRLYVDDLPSATMVHDPDDPDKNMVHPDYDDGIPVGVYNEKDGSIMIYNHLKMTILTHFEGGSDQKQRIVGFDVEPQSIHYDEHGEGDDVVVEDNHEAKP